MKFEVPSFTISTYIIAEKIFKMCHVTLTTPLLWVVCHP